MSRVKIPVNRYEKLREELNQLILGLIDSGDRGYTLFPEVNPTELSRGDVVPVGEFRGIDFFVVA